MRKTLLYCGTVVAGLAGSLAASSVTRPSAQPASHLSVQIDGDDIGGVVTSKHGPEAGVWVIAETTELGTRFAKIAVTDDHGRYVIPDLPRPRTACGCEATDSSTRPGSRPRAAGS